MITWDDVRKANEKYVQGDLPGMDEIIKRAEESRIDHEAFIRRKQALAQRWFKYYKSCKDPKKKDDLIRQYNMVATMRQR